MYKATLTLAILAVAKLAMAAEPACLIAAVNKFDHPADQKTICTKEADKAQTYIKDICSSKDVDAATKAFKDYCSAASYDAKISNSTSSSASGKPSGTGYKTAAYTTTYYDTKCGCTTTKAVKTTYAAASTGFATGTAPVVTGTAAASAAGAGGAGSFGSDTAATGSPIAPASPSSTAGNKFAGAASHNMVSSGGALIALGAFVMVL